MFRIFLLVAVLILSACGAPQTPPGVTVTSTSRPEPTALPTLDAWTQAAGPIALDNVQQLTQLGRLDAPEPPSTLFTYALALDNAQMAGLNNDFVLVWDLVTGELLFGSDRLGANVVMFGPDRQEIYTLSAAGELRIYNTERGDPVETLGVFDEYNGIWAYDPVGGWLAVGSDVGAAQIWDMPARTPIAVLEGPPAPLTALAFSPDGATLAASNENGTISLWDFVAGSIRASNDLMTPITASLYAPSVDALAVDTGDGTLVIDPVTARVKFRLTETPNAGVMTFLGQTDTLLLGGGSSDLTLWDTAAGRLIAVLPGTQGDRPSADSSPDGDMVLASNRSGASFWNLSGLTSGTILRGNATLPEADLVRTVWTDDGLQILLFESVGPVRVMGIP